MGQYYVFTNMDKKEFALTGGDYTTKLMECAWMHSWGSQALMTLLAGQWAGDRVIVLGDYASFTGYDDINKIESFTNAKLFTETYRDYVPSVWPSSPYAYVLSNYKLVTVRRSDFIKNRYIYNEETKQRIDLYESPASQIIEDGIHSRALYINPVVLLLAVGNGLGGGDFKCCAVSGEKYVGAWIASSDSLRLSNTINYSYALFKPEFAESNYIAYYQASSRVRHLRACAREK